jgi:PadR family transcriptional regulator PadR
MNTETLHSLSYKDLLALCMLHLIDAGEISPSVLLEELKKLDLLKTEGVIYPVLAEMKSKGWISARQVESESLTARKYYHITDEGKTALVGLDHSWQELVNKISGLVRRKSEI